MNIFIQADCQLTLEFKSMDKKDQHSMRKSRDRNVLLNQLPEEVWLLILDKANFDPPTLRACISSSSVFRDWMHIQTQTRNNYLCSSLFPLVWTYLFWTLTPPKPVSYADRKGFCSLVLCLRRVCRAWCYGVDEFYKCPKAYHFSKKYNGILDDELPFKKDLLTPHGLGKTWDTFLCHFGKTHAQTMRSPFVGGWITLDLDLIQQLGFQMLQLYGRHIRHCGLTFQSLQSQGTWVKQVNSILKKLPDVNTLVFTCLVSSNQTVRQWDQDLLLSPFSKLTHLKVLNVYNVPAPLVEALVSINSDTLQHIACNCSETINPKKLLQKLTFLLTKVQKKNDIFLLNAAKNLEVFVVKFSNATNSWTLAEILHVLEENVSKNVHTLFIHLPKLYFQTARKFDKLRLVGVQRLKLDLQDWMPLDFILPMAADIQALSVTIRSEVFDKWSLRSYAKIIASNEKIGFLNCHRDMRKSNIWRFLPRLNILKLQIPVLESRFKIMVWSWKGRNMIHKNWSVDSIDEDFPVYH